MTPAFEVRLLLRGNDQQLVDFVSKLALIKDQLGAEELSYISSNKMFLPETTVTFPLSPEDANIEYE